MDYKTLESCFDEAFDCFFILDQNLTIQYWNYSMQAFTGINEQKAVGKPIFDIIPSLQAECQYYLEEAVLIHKRHIELQLLRFAKPISGKTASVKARFFPLEQENTDTRLVCIMRPVRSDLPEEHEYPGLLNSVITHTKDAVLITETKESDYPNGPKIIYCNPAFTQMTGYQSEEILGLTPRVLQGPKTDPQSTSFIKKCIKNWESVNCELINYKKDGQEFWVDLGIVPVKNEEGFFTHWIAIQRDTTDKRRNLHLLHQTNVQLEARVKERTADLELFSQYLAHDLKAPIKNIHSLIDLIEAKFSPFPEDLSTLFSLVKQASESTYGMIKGLSRLLKIGDIAIHKTKVAFSDIMQDAQNNLADLIESSNAKISIAPLPEVYADHNLMLSVIQNLLANSIKYAGDKAPQIDIEAHQESAHWHFTFADQGIGINANQLEQVFQIFYRSEMSAYIPGVGIGLAICKKAVDKHDGQIYIKDNHGPGCTVHLRLPIIEP